MAQQAIITLSGPFISVCDDQRQPLPPPIVRLLGDQLSYNHIERLTPTEARRTGKNVEVIPTRLFHYDEYEHFVTNKGFLTKVTNLLETRGFDITVRDINESKDPKIYHAQWEQVMDRFDLREGQLECLAQIDMHDGGVIEAVPAFGKTWIIAMLCLLYPYAKIDIIVGGKGQKAIAQKLKLLLLQYMPEIGQVGGGRKRKGRVTLYLAGSMHHSGCSADIVLADEVHELMTRKKAEFLGRYAARVYGFTATANTRADNAHARMEGLCGPTIFKLTYQDAQTMGVVAPVRVQWIEQPETMNSPCYGIVDEVTRKRLGIWTNEVRNQTIAAAAQQFRQDGNQVLLLVETVEHGLYLQRHLPDFILCCSENAHAFNDPSARRRLVAAGVLNEHNYGPTGEQREIWRQQFESREVMGAIATGVWSVGVSFDSLEVLGRCDGGSSETANIQHPGRVCRVADGKEFGMLLDSQDNFDEVFQERAYRRRTAYRRLGWEQYLPDGTLWEPYKRKAESANA
jgi:hypothetical protein